MCTPMEMQQPIDAAKLHMAIEEAATALEHATTATAKDYFGRAFSLSDSSLELWSLLQTHAEDGNGGGASATAIDAVTASTQLTPQIPKKRTHANAIQVSFMCPDDDTSCMEVAGKHAVDGFKRPWITLNNSNSQARVSHFVSASHLRRAWAHALRTLAQRHGAVFLNNLRISRQLRFALAMHFSQCEGVTADVLLDGLQLRAFLTNAVRRVPWYSRYVNHFSLPADIPRAQWIGALAQLYTGYPMSLIAMLLAVRETSRVAGTLPSLQAYDVPPKNVALHRLLFEVPSYDLHECADVLRLQHSLACRRLNSEMLVERELADLIVDLQIQFGAADDEIDAYARRFLLTRTHSARFERCMQQPLLLRSDTTEAHEAGELAGVSVIVRKRMREYYGRRDDNLSYSTSRENARLGSCTGADVSVQHTDLFTLLTWFAAKQRWAVCAQLVLMNESQRLAYRAFPRSLWLSVFKTAARVEGTLGEECIDRWLVVESPFHQGECWLVGTAHFWHRFSIQQSQVYLSACSLPGLFRSRHADMFSIVRALLCGDDFTVCHMFANVLLNYMCCGERTTVPYALVRDRCNHYRYMPHLLRTLFTNADEFIKVFHDTTLYVPRSETLLHSQTGEWIGLPKRWDTRHGMAAYPHRPHLYYALIAYLSPHRTVYIYYRMMHEVWSEMRAKGVFHRRTAFGSKRFSAPFPDDSPDQMFYNHMDEWMSERIALAERAATSWIPLCDDDLMQPRRHKLHEQDAHMSIIQCWYQLCCDEAVLSLDTRRRMFMCVALDEHIFFPGKHHNLLTSDCQFPLEWVKGMLKSAAFGTHIGDDDDSDDDDDDESEETAAKAAATDEARISSMHEYFLDECLAEPSAYNDSLWHPRRLRTWPVYNRDALEILATLVCILRDGMIFDVPAPHERDECPFGNSDFTIADPKRHAHERAVVENARYESVASSVAGTRFTAMTRHRNAQAARRARKFGVAFMTELKRLLQSEGTEEHCYAMTYKAHDAAPLRVGSQAILLVSEDMRQYNTHADSPANTLDNTLLAEAGMFTRYQRNDMRRRLMDRLGAATIHYLENTAIPSALVRNNQVPDDERDQDSIDALEDLSPLVSLKHIHANWFFYTLWNEQRRRTHVVVGYVHAFIVASLSVGDLMRCSRVCKRWNTDLTMLCRHQKEIYQRK